MTGAVEEAGRATHEFIGALRKEWPLSLALVVMNFALLFFFYFILEKVAAQREREVGLIYEDKKEIREILMRCVVPERRGELMDPLRKGAPPIDLLPHKELN